MLLFGHASIAVHAASHLASDAGDCEYCTSHHHPTAALAHPTGTQVAIPRPDVVPISWHEEFVPARLIAAVRQRGPPPPI